MIVAILAFYLGYSRAKANGRNPALWAIICGVVFIGLQLLTTALAGVLVGIGAAFWGWSPSILDDNPIWVILAALAVSFVGLFIVLKFIDRPLPEEDTPPPPPPTFGDGPGLD